MLCCLWFVAAMQRRSKQSADKSSEQQRQDRIKICIQRTYRCNPMSRASADDRDRFYDLHSARMLLPDTLGICTATSG
jgi:hypothetical protein